MQYTRKMSLPNIFRYIYCVRDTIPNKMAIYKLTYCIHLQVETTIIINLPVPSLDAVQSKITPCVWPHAQSKH